MRLLSDGKSSLWSTSYNWATGDRRGRRHEWLSRWRVCLEMWLRRIEPDCSLWFLFCGALRHLSDGKCRCGPARVPTIQPARRRSYSSPDSLRSGHSQTTLRDADLVTPPKVASFSTRGFNICPSSPRHCVKSYGDWPWVLTRQNVRFQGGFDPNLPEEKKTGINCRCRPGVTEGFLQWENALTGNISRCGQFAHASEVGH